MNRRPVPEKPLAMFYLIFSEMVEVYGVNSRPELRPALEAFRQVCEKSLFNENNDGQKVVGNDERFRYLIASYNANFTEMVGVAPHQMHPKDAKQLNGLVADIAEKGLSVKEYSKWFFESYCPRVPNMMPPSYGLFSSENTRAKFYLEFKQQMKKVETKKVAVAEVDAVFAMARQTQKDYPALANKIADLLDFYQRNGISLLGLKNRIIKYGEEGASLK